MCAFWQLAFKVSVVEGQADAIQAQAFEESGILVLEEVLEELLNRSAPLSLMQDHELRTLSKKNSDFSGPTTSANAARIWNSHPGYPEMKFSMLR